MTIHFSSIAAFAAHIPVISSQTLQSEHMSLEKSGKIVEIESKSEIGQYQGQAGPFAAWPPLADTTISGFRGHSGNTNDTPLLRSGDLRDSIHHEVEGMTAVIGSTSEVAIYQELGTKTIPPRSFLGAALFRKSGEVENEIAAHVVAALCGVPIP